MIVKHLYNAKELFDLISKTNEIGSSSTLFSHFLKFIDFKKDEYFIGEITNINYQNNSEIPFRESSYAFIHKTQDASSGQLIIDQKLNVKQYFESEKEQRLFNMERTIHYEPEYNISNIFGLIILVLPPKIKEEILNLGVITNTLFNA